MKILLGLLVIVAVLAAAYISVDSAITGLVVREKFNTEESVCESYGINIEARDGCWWSLSDVRNDKTLCEKITDDQTRTQCLAWHE